MNLEILEQCLYKEINNAQALKCYKEAAEEIWELFAFDTPEHIVNLFKEHNPEHNDVKSQLLKIMLTYYQDTSDKLWSSLLILCFMPWLQNCFQMAKAKSRGDTEEITLLVIECFLESASSTKLCRDVICILSMLLNTEKLIVQQVLHDLEREKAEVPFDDIEEEAGFIMTPEDELIVRQLHMDDEQAACIKGRRDTEMMRLLSDIVINNDTVVDYVDRHYDTTDPENKLKKYNSIFKQLERFTKKVKFDCQDLAQKTALV